MKTHKRILKVIAKNYKIDPDEILVFLWDYPDKRNKFNYLKNENSVVKNEDLKFILDVIYKLKERLPKTNKVENKSPVKLIYKDYDFSSVGKIVDPVLYVTKEEILKIYSELITDSENLNDPIYPIGLRDENLLDSALFHPQTSYQGAAKYKTIESLGAALMYSISNNHAFHNGNKRTAMIAMLIFLDRHHISLICDEDSLFKISIKLADHTIVDESYRYNDAEIYALAHWIKENSRVIEKGERLITLRKLKRILPRFNCQILENGRIERIIIKKSFLGNSKKRYLSKVSIGNTISDGSEIDRKLIKSIREDLMLNPENGIDSASFYEEADFTSSEFIIKYKNLLKRLSKT